MTGAPHRFAARADTRLLLFALANAGGVIGFLPLLTLLLPLKIAGIAPDARIGLVTVTTIAGALAASASNIAFGWWSDRLVAAGGGRRRFIGGGMVATALSYGAVAAAATPAQIVGAIVVFQIAVNAMLGPFQAAMADEIPDQAKGVAGGLLALANPMASAVSAAVIGVAIAEEGARLAIVAAAMVACTLPLLLTRAAPVQHPAPSPQRGEGLRRDLQSAWIARLLVQIAGSVLFYYLLYYFQSVATGEPADTLAARVGQLMTIAYVLPLPVAVLIGRLSDRLGRRKPFLIGAAGIAAVGLVALGLARDWSGAAAAFALYAVGSSTFLALHSTFAMQLLPDPARRGRDLGLLNLTNPAPALIGPLLTWALATPRDFTALMLTLAVLTTLGALAILGVRGRR